MLFLYRFICGYLEIVFYGEFPEKMLNICAKNSITLWGSKYVKGKIFSKITIADFLKLRLFLKGTKIRVHIIKKHGLPFIIKRYKRRMGIYFGFIIFALALYFLSQHIWIIEVEGNKKLSETEVLNICYSMGIKEGILSNKINPKIMAQEILLKTDKLSWASLNIEGSKLVVNVSETKKKEGATSPTNLKARHDGVITHLDITSGNCVVKIGDTVKKGDLLVSGIIEGASGTRFVEAKGSVIAETEIEINLSEKFKQYVCFKTGKVKVKKVISFFGLKIPLYLGKEKGDYESIQKVKTLKVFDKKLPIVIYTKKFIFFKKSGVTYSKSQLENILNKKLLKELEKEKIYDYTLKNKEFFANSNEVQLKAQIITKKDITKSENLIINIGN